MLKRCVIAIALVGACFLAGCKEASAPSEDTSENPSPVVGQQVALQSGDFSSCSVCHGSVFQGNQTTLAPRLNHLPSWYIENQFKAFKAGWRGAHPEDVAGAGMYRTALLMDDKTVKAVIDYLKAFRQEISDFSPGPLYLEKCASCHGETGKGIQDLNAPGLAGASAWYIGRQLANYKKGWRGANEDDVNGQMMAATAKSLTQEDIDAILADFTNP